MKDIDYYMLCTKDIKNDISNKDKEILTHWLKNSSKNQEVYNQIKKIHGLENRTRNADSMSKETIWNDLYNKILTEQKRQWDYTLVLNRLNITQFFTYRRLAYAISFLFIFFLMTIFIQQYLFTSETDIITTRYKEKRIVILPDQSKVILNSDSKLEYPEVFNGNVRSVQLDGEAFFTVRKNRIPFIITSKNASIQVVGTEFNVWARDNETRVAVKNGHVRLNTKKENTNNYVTLYKDQMSFVKDNEKPQLPKKIDIAVYLDWLENRLVFEKTPLSEVVEEIERFYDVTIKLDKKLQDRLLTAEFTDTSIEPVLDKICLVFDARYSYKEKVYSITY